MRLLFLHDIDIRQQLFTIYMCRLDFHDIYEWHNGTHMFVAEKRGCRWSKVLNCPIDSNPRWWRCQICSRQPIRSNTIAQEFYSAQSVPEISMFQLSNLTLKLITLFILISPCRQMQIKLPIIKCISIRFRDD